MAHISYAVLEPDYFQRALQFYRESFIPREPVLYCLGCHKMSNEKLDGLMLQRFSENLTWIAIDESTGKLVGIRVSHCIAAKDLPDSMLTYEDHIHSGWSEAFAAMNVIDDATLDVKEVLKQFNETRLLKLGGLAVDPGYENKGIASELIRRSLADGSQKGFSLAGVVATGNASQSIFRKLGFQETKAVYYRDFHINGEPRLKNIDCGTESQISFVKRI